MWGSHAWATKQRALFCTVLADTERRQKKEKRKKKEE